MTIPREITADEARDEFLAHINNLVKYWARLPGKTVEERCDGVAFSILCVFDGVTDLPAMDIALSPHPDDQAFHQSEGENWYVPGMVINDCHLHDLWGDLRRRKENG